MGRELGRISGPLLAENLLRNGSDLAFETKLLYLDVNTPYVGINTNTPTRDLLINGTADMPYAIVDTDGLLASLDFSTNQIQNLTGSITISPSQASNPTVTVPSLTTGAFNITTNTIANSVLNDSITIAANGTGQVVVGTVGNNTNALVNGNLHATGNITWDGNITLGDNLSSDTIAFTSEINSDIIPKTSSFYDLGDKLTPLRWATAYVNTAVVPTINVTNVSSTTITGSQTGTENLNGDVIFGTTSTNTLAVNSVIVTDLIPSTTNTRSLGSSSYYWLNSYFTTFTDGTLSFNGSSVTTTTTNTNLQLGANGTGKVIFANLSLANNATFGSLTDTTGLVSLTTTTAGAITQTGNFTQTGVSYASITGAVQGNDITVTGVSSRLILPGITVNGSSIASTTTNTDITFTPNGTGKVYVPNNDVAITNNLSVTGTLGVTGLSSLANTTTGAITQTGDFNTTGNTGITGDLSAVNLTMTGVGSQLNTGNFIISGSTVAGQAANADTIYSANGTGGVAIQNLKITSSTISNIFDPNNASVNIAYAILTEVADTLTTETGDPFITDRILDLDYSVILKPTGQNLLLYSQDFSQTQWVNSVTKTSYNNTAPDSTSTALLFTTTGSGLQYLYQGSIAVTQLTTYTFSFYAKLGTLSASDWTMAVYNETASAMIAFDVPTNVTLNTTDWQRIVYTFTTPAGCTNVRVYPFRNSVLATVKTGYVWGAQLVNNPNLLLTQDFTNPNWLKQPAVTISTSSTISPDGVSTAVKYNLNAPSGRGVDLAVPAFTIGQKYTFSVWIKAIVDTSINIGIVDSSTTYIVANFGVPATVAQGWTNFSFTFTAPANFAYVQFQDTSGFTGDRFYCWGPQLIVASNPAGYLLTTSTQQTGLSSIGTGNVIVSSTKAITIPVGNTSDRILSAVGEIRQNSTTNLYEGYSPSGLISFNNLYDTDRNSYVTAELTPGLADNIIRFGISGTVKALLDSNKFYSDSNLFGNINISGQTISNAVSDINLVPSGTGVTKINRIAIKDNTFTNLPTVPNYLGFDDIDILLYPQKYTQNNSLTITSTGAGYVKFSGTNGMVIPFGTTAQQKAIPEVGAFRFNTELNYTEVYDGTKWGISSGSVNYATEDDISVEANLWAFIFGR